MDDDKYMDERFQQAGEELKFPYRRSYWEEVEMQLNDDSLDKAFKTAAGNMAVIPPMPDLAESLDDAFMDDAFKSAAGMVSAQYRPEYWSQLVENIGVMAQDEAFVAASNTVIADYRPHYWNDADLALQKEGLHYEYNRSYWKEARLLLDRADRRVFFLKWSAVAAVLLLLSFGGVYSSLNKLQTHTAGVAEQQPVIGSSAGYGESAPESVMGHLSVAGKREITTGIREAWKNGSNKVDQNPVSTGPDQLITGTGAENNTALHAIPNPDLVPEDATTTVFLTPEAGSLIRPTRNSRYMISSALSEESSSAQKTPGQPGTLIRTINPGYDVAYVEITKDQKPGPVHTVAFFGQAGLGNKYGSSELVPSWRTNFGFEYTYSSNIRLRNFEFGGSLAMSHVRQNDFGTERRSETFNYAGTKDKFWYKLQLKDMLYANATASMAYKINDIHKIRLDFTYDQLVFVQSNMAYRTDPDKGVTTVNNNWGVKDGLTRYDFRLGLGYEVRLSNRFAFRVSGSYGFVDRTDNSFMRNEVVDHEMNVMAGIKYTLFNKQRIPAVQ